MTICGRPRCVSSQVQVLKGQLYNGLASVASIVSAPGSVKIRSHMLQMNQAVIRLSGTGNACIIVVLPASD